MPALRPSGDIDASRRNDGPVPRSDVNQLIAALFTPPVLNLSGL
jgi:hypothetical protein